MSVSQPDGRRRAARRVGYACLALPFVAMLWVHAYARSEPPLFGLPFFYWYQFVWVLLTPVLMAVAYLLLRPKPTGDGIGTAP